MAVLGMVLVLGSCMISGLQHRGIPSECFINDVGLTEDEFRSKHGRPDEIHKFGAEGETLWYQGVGPWGMGRGDGVIFDKNHRVKFTYVD